MARLFRLLPDDDGWLTQSAADVSGRHQLKAPGIKCPKCGTYSTTGISFPEVDEALIANLLPKNPFPLSLDEFETLSTRVSRELPWLPRLQPGTEFGRLRGKSSGPYADFMWVNKWTPLVRAEMLRPLESIGCQAQESLLETTEVEPLFELFAPPIACASSSIPTEKCELCGRVSTPTPDTIIISSSNFDFQNPIQRVQEWPTVLVVTSAFVECVRKNHWNNTSFFPLELD